jgi:hypothetical protein
MKFIPTKAKYNSRYGLFLKDDSSPWYAARTKYPVLALGVVTLSHGYFSDSGKDPDIPYWHTFTYGGEEHTIPATDDLAAVALALKAHNGELPQTSLDEWVEIPIPKD